MACGLPLKTAGDEAAARQTSESRVAGLSGRQLFPLSSCLDRVATHYTGFPSLRQAAQCNTLGPTGNTCNHCCWYQLVVTGAHLRSHVITSSHWGSLIPMTSNEAHLDADSLDGQQEGIE